MKPSCENAFIEGSPIRVQPYLNSKWLGEKRHINFISKYPVESHRGIRFSAARNRFRASSATAFSSGFVAACAAAEAIPPRAALDLFPPSPPAPRMATLAGKGVSLLAATDLSVCCAVLLLAAVLLTKRAARKTVGQNERRHNVMILSAYVATTALLTA
jgi:hypothetical protein